MATLNHPTSARAAIQNFVRRIRDLLRAGVAFASAVLLVVMIVGCVGIRGDSQLIDHSFEFNVISDSPEATLLDYRYGRGEMPVTAPRAWMKAAGPMRQQGGVTAPMPVGNDLYVKWRVNATGEVLEQTVDLRNRLPSDMTNHKIYFVIRKRELFVYLISPEKRPQNWPKYEPPGWTHRKVYVVYPTSTLH